MVRTEPTGPVTGTKLWVSDKLLLLRTQNSPHLGTPPRVINIFMYILSDNAIVIQIYLRFT